MTALADAREYVGRGWPVLPLRPKTKVPAIANGVRGATTDLERVEAWFGRHADWGVAIACGAPGPTVLDIDDLGAAPREVLELVAPTVATARGRHVYFAGLDSATVALPYGELRGTGSYVAAPESVHPSGKIYVWTTKVNGALPPAPAFLLEGRPGAGAGTAPPAERVPPGAMYEYLKDRAVRLVRAGMRDPEAIRRALFAEFEAVRDPEATYNGGPRDTGRLAEWAARSEIAERERRAPSGSSSNGAGPPTENAEVDTAELLDEVRTFITRFVVLPSTAAADLLAIWVLHTHAFEAFWATPYLRVVSAAPDSGKTLLLEVLAAICRRGWHAVNPSVAVLYRRVDRDTPTLLLDEMDNYPLDDRRDALTVLNDGYKRGATVDRCKENGDLVSFNAFCPKAYAGLDTRQLVPTLLSRSLTLRMERKTAAERAEMWIAHLVGPEAEELRGRCQVWGERNVEQLAGHRPDLLGLFNRAAEVWWPLLTIAEHAGGGWPRRAAKAAKAFASGGDATDDTPDQVQLLLDIRDALGNGQTVTTAILLARLNELDESPWGARRKGEGLDARGLAGLLRPFGIRSRTVRVGEKTAKGYHLEQFEDAFARHLPGGSPEGSHPSQGSHPASGLERDVTDVTDVTDNPTPGPDQ
jgi:hypothetical protein